MEQIQEQKTLEEEKQKNILCDYCKERIATLTMDTPKYKNVPLCDFCFKKVNVLAGVMKGNGVMSLKEIFDKVKGATTENWKDYTKVNSEGSLNSSQH